MRFFKALIIICVASFLTTSCFEDNDDNAISANQINDFVWKGMNVWYLYKDNIPDLANDRFSTNEEYASYLNSFSTPEDLFESLIYQRETIDNFSWITDNYIANDQLLNGISLSNGMEYGLFRFSPQDTDLYGYVRYILPNTDAETKGLKRGDIFYAVDGTQITINNYTSLLSSDSYNINLGTYDENGTAEVEDDFIIPDGETISLTKSEYTKNPIYTSTVLNIETHTIGYLMYNGFNGSSSELNTVFSTFNSSGITDLVLDLRYNPGGFTSKAILMASLITGQFNGEILNIDQYNSELQAAYESLNPELLLDRFINSENGMSLNSLNLDKVYVLVSKSSASASEFVINALNPYIDVVQIGTNTRGKYQGSFSLYDSPDFTKDGINPNHTYALQPLTFKYSNVNGNTDFVDGLSPDIVLGESIRNLGVLGNENEPLFAEAIADITGISRSANLKNNSTETLYEFLEADDNQNRMVKDKKIPQGVIQRLFLNQ